MKIEIKIWLLLLLFIFLGTVVTFTVLRNRSLAAFNALEKDAVRQAAEALQDVYNREQDWLRRRTKQWALVLNEVNHRAPTATTEDGQRFDLRNWFDRETADFVAVMREGEVVERLFFTPDGHELRAFPFDLERQLSQDPMLTRHSVANGQVSGLIATESTFYLLTSVPLTDSGEPRHATLTLGVRWEHVNLWLTARRLGCGLKLYRWNEPMPSAEALEMKSELAGGGGIRVAGDEVHGYKAFFPLVNLYGDPLVIVRVTRPFAQRLISHGLAQSTALSLMAVLVVLGGTLALYLRMSVFGRLHDLRSDLADIEIAAHLRGAKVSQGGTDEVGRLAESIGRLIRRLRRSRMRTVRGEYYLFELLDRISDLVFLVSVDNRTIVRPNATAVEKLANGERDRLIGVGLSDVLRFEVPNESDFMGLLLDDMDGAGDPSDIEQPMPFTAVVRSVDDRRAMVRGQAFLLHLMHEKMALFIMCEDSERPS